MGEYAMQTHKQLELNFVDISAWWPIKGSNSFFLYKKGFPGAVVEQNPHFERTWKADGPRNRYLTVIFGIENPAKLPTITLYIWDW